MKAKLHNENGVALVLALAILILLSAFAVFFTSKARTELLKATQFKNAAKAFYLAAGGMHRALYELKFHPTSGQAAVAGVGINAQDTRLETWFFPQGPQVPLQTAANVSFQNLDGLSPNETEQTAADSRIRLKIIDSASLINLNSKDPGGLRLLLENLLNGILTPADVTAILNLRATFPSQEFKRVEDILSTIGQVKFDAVRFFLTVHSYIDARLITPDPSYPLKTLTVSINNSRAPINVNTANVEVLKAALRNLPGISNAEADGFAAALAARVVTDPFETWQEFETYLASQTGILPVAADRQNILTAVNPNKPKDANPPQKYAAEFCFSSLGFYEIESLGKVVNNSGKVLAARQLKMAAKVFDVFRISTRDDLIGGFDAGGNTVVDHDTDAIPNIVDGSLVNPNNVGSSIASFLDDEFGDWRKPGFLNTTWYDSTPINPDDDLGFRYATNYETRPGAIKLGFWDNFDESTIESSQFWFQTTGYLPPFNPTGPSYFIDVRTTPHWIGPVNPNNPALDADKELWQDFSDDPLLDTPPYSDQTQTDDRVAFLLGGFLDPFVDNQKKNNFIRWDGDFYARVFTSDDPRITRTDAGNIPGVAATDLAGRDYLNVGYVMFRLNKWRGGIEHSFLFAQSTTGNYYEEENRFPVYTYGGNPYQFDFDGSTTIGGLAAIRSLQPQFYPAPINPPGILNIPNPPGPTPYAFADNNPYPASVHTRGYLPTNIPTSTNTVFVNVKDPFIFYLADNYLISNPTSLPLERDKTYRLRLKNDVVDAQIIYSSDPDYFYSPIITSFGITNLEQRGSFGLLGRGSHSAWDDVRLIGRTGSYTSAAFSPGNIGVNNDNILWGTFSWTESRNTVAPENPNLSVTLLFASGDVLASPPVAASTTFPGPSRVPFGAGGAGGAIFNANAISAPYNFFRIWVQMTLDDIAPTTGRAPHIPMFEDATATYLKDTKIYYTQER